MKNKTKKLIIDTIALLLLCGMFIACVVLSGYIMRLGVAIESDMPSMSENLTIDK